MTDRLKGFLVTLDRDIREDDARSTIAAIKHIRGVVSVKPLVSEIEDQMARARVTNELVADVYELVKKWQRLS